MGAAEEGIHVVDLRGVLHTVPLHVWRFHGLLYALSRFVCVLNFRYGRVGHGGRCLGLIF